MLLRRRAALALLAIVSIFTIPAQGATLVVTSTADAGAGSLRDTLTAAGAGDTITFSVTGTIALASTLSIAQSVTIQGPGAASLTLSGVPTIRIINLTAGTLTLTDITLANGNTTGLGGAVQVGAAATLVVSRAVFNANSASNGGAIANAAGATTSVDSSTFSGNTTTGVGGGAVINFGTAMLTNSTFVGNTAPINGAAINTQPGAATTTVINSTFSGNTSGSLGGATSNLGTTNLYDSTFSNNTATSGAVLASINATVVLDNNVMADNSTDALNPTAGLPGSNNVFYNNNSVNDATGYGTTNFRAATSEPLRSLANNGGLTQTQLPVSGGAAICEGSIALIPAGVTTDQRGLPRTFSGCVDAGSVQFSQPVGVPALTSMLIWMLAGFIVLVGGVQLRRLRSQ